MACSPFSLLPSFSLFAAIDAAAVRRVKILEVDWTGDGSLPRFLRRLERDLCIV
jgi:hypothetical protein